MATGRFTSEFRARETVYKRGELWIKKEKEMISLLTTNDSTHVSLSFPLSSYRLAVHAGVLCIVFILSLVVHNSVAGSNIVLLPNDGVNSYVYPSIERDGTTGDYNITYIKAPNYHDPYQWLWEGELHAATLRQNESGEYTLEDKWSQPQTMVGFGAMGSQENRTWRNWMRPVLRGGVVASPQWFGDPMGIRYYDFGTGQDGVIDSPRSLNPRVSPSGKNIAYWGLGELGWNLQVFNREYNNPAAIPIVEPQPFSLQVGDQSYFIPNTVDIWDAPDGKSGRLVWSEGSGMGSSIRWAGFEWMEEQMPDGSLNHQLQVQEGGTLRSMDMSGWGEGVTPLFSNIFINENYVVYQEGIFDSRDQPATWPAGLYGFIWNIDGYNWMNAVGGGDTVTEPYLFGRYLAYASPDGTQIRIVNLDINQETVIAEDINRFMSAPAVWVDELTGDYIMLYQVSASPADLMMVTGTFSAVPEPGGLVVFAVGLVSLGGMLISRQRSAVAP